MYFEISRKELHNPLKLVASVIESKHSIPVLAHVLLRVENSTLYLVGTDSEVEVSCNLPLEQNLDDSANGEITIPGRKFLDIVRSLDDRNSLQFQLDTEEEKATIKSGKSRFTLHTLPSDDFPISPEISNNYQIKLPKALLRDLLKQTLFAIANNDVRYYLNGLCFDFKPDGLTVVATDGHRLALAMTEFDVADNEPLRVIVPKKAVLELERMLDGGEDEIIINVDERHIKFILSETLILSSQLIDGKFPDYEQVIPKKATKIMTAKVAEFKNALVQASILSNEKYRGIKLSLDANMVTVSSRNPEREEAEVHCEIDYHNDEEDADKFEIGFNVNYLQDALAVIYTEEVQLHFTEVGNSCLITPKDITSSKFVVMPMRL